MQNVGRTLTINDNNCKTYFTGASGIDVGGNHYGYEQVICITTAKSGTVKLSDTAKAVLYPNSTAHPTSAYIYWPIQNTVASGQGTVKINSATVFDKSYSYSTDAHHYDSSTSTAAGVLSSIKSSTIEFSLSKGAALIGYAGTSSDQHIDITLYFNRYDFSASAGTGVSSATVSSSTGYNGDSISYSCSIPAGYIFDGWYNGNTLVSNQQTYVYTVNGTDLALTAKAHQDFHNVNGTYNGSTKAILTNISGNVVVSYADQSIVLPTQATTHTMSCKDKIMKTNVSVGSVELQCGVKTMLSNLTITYV